MGYGWEGRAVRLTPLDKERHLENAVRWMNDPRVTEWLLVGDFPLTKLAEEEWLEAASKRSESDIAFAIETLDGRHIGFSGIHNISFRHGFATTGSLLGEPELWGKGYGTDAALVRARYCFEVLGLRMLLSDYLDGNESSAKMQLKAGYVEYGRVPGKYWKRNAFRDHILTRLSRETLQA